MNYMVRAEVSNGMVLATTGDINGMMLGVCTDPRFLFAQPPQNNRFRAGVPCFL